MQTIDQFFHKKPAKMSRKLRQPARTQAKTTEKDAAPAKKTATDAAPHCAPKGKDESPAEYQDRMERFSQSIAHIRAKWVDPASMKHWPLADVTFGGCRDLMQDGIETIKNSLADCASLKGKERNNPLLLRGGIMPGTFLTMRKTNTGVVCEEGNHKLSVYRDFL